jgi:undecaprenyl phosphate-alpha-L-ara4N flippase subunit ArnE
MISKNYKAILIILFCTIFTSIGQIFFKIGADRITTVSSLMYNWPLIFGLMSYATGSIFLIISLKYGELSIVYPFIALSFVWVNLLSIFIFDEKVILIEWLGIITIITGVYFIGYGSSEHSLKH